MQSDAMEIGKIKNTLYIVDIEFHCSNYVSIK